MKLLTAATACAVQHKFCAFQGLLGTIPCPPPPETASTQLYIRVSFEGGPICVCLARVPYKKNYRRVPVLNKLISTSLSSLASRDGCIVFWVSDGSWEFSSFSEGSAPCETKEHNFQG